jgi:endonuclease YncB( thermonuclease family)
MVVVCMVGCASLRAEGKESQQRERSVQKRAAVRAEATERPCGPSEGGFSCVKVVDVYDGDTLFIDIPGIPPVFGKRIGVRILGIDTAEMRSKDPCEKERALQAKGVVKALIKKAQRVDIVQVQRDKYFRILGQVTADGRSIGEELIAKKLAFPYFGDAKPKRDWCKK